MSAPPGYRPRRLSPAELLLLGVGHGVCDRCGVAGRVMRVAAELWCPLCAGHETKAKEKP
ncbi:MAG: hypothetical protein ACRDTG_26875 [Pseudonocardiaceae bacterium]